MRQTDYKVDRIKVFIQTHNPTKSELIKHIAVDINKISSRHFDINKRNFRGYYNTNIQTMRYAGNIATDKNGKYYVTEQGLNNENSLYIKPDKKRVRELQSLVDYKNGRIRELKQDNRKLEREIKELKQTLENIHNLSK